MFTNFNSMASAITLGPTTKNVKHVLDQYALQPRNTEEVTSVAVIGQDTFILQKVDAQIIICIFHLFPRCNTLTLRLVDIHDSREWMVKNGNVLTSLTLHNVHINSPRVDTAALVAMLPNVRTLELIHVDWADEGVWQLGANPPKTYFRCLQIGPINAHSLWRLERLLAGAHNTLTNIHVTVGPHHGSTSLSKLMHARLNLVK
jgi:hypothetical protein